MFINNLFKHWMYQLFAPGAVLRKKYEAYKSLLSHDKNAHELMAELEEIYYRQIPVDFMVIQEKYEELSRHVAAIIHHLSRICPTRYRALGDYFKKLDMLGRLLGATRLMDMYLKDESMVDVYTQAFMNGRYHFATEDLNA